MKKEMIISVLVGLFFGLIIVYGVYTSQNSLSNPNQAEEELGVSPSPNPEQAADSNLSILSPEDETIVDTAEITIAGTTLANNYVIIFINDQELITNADESGNFSIKGELELGSNVIQVHTIDESGQKTVKEKTVIYSTKPLIENPDDEISAETDVASESADTTK